MQAEPGNTVEPIFELKFGQVGIANLRLRVSDAQTLHAEIKRRVKTAPTLFERAPLVLDLGSLATLPDIDATRALLDAVRTAGMLPVGLAYGTPENEQLARQLKLPLFAKFRAAASSGVEKELPALQAQAAPAASLCSQHHDKPVRSGQQIYAQGRDLVLNASVGNGAEVIADGSIHVYGRLSGRAMAGAQGNTNARIYCTDFRAELVSIAGCYRVFEEFPAALRGKPVQAWLDGEKLLLAAL
ncbi:MAG: septum site-determining protein MinC [Rudaea sp.]